MFNLIHTVMRVINIKGYEGLYTVTDDGRVFNVQRGRELKPKVVRGGYFEVQLWKNNKRKYFYVHHLVYNSFHKVGYDSSEKYEMAIDHINEDRQDNRLENLQKVTYRENTARSQKNRKAGLPTGITYWAERDKYRARINIKKEYFYLGVFPTAEEAGKAYEDARLAYEEHGIKPQKRDKTKKKCGRCGQTLPREEFYRTRKGAISWMCKKCSCEYAHEQWEKGKAKKKAEPE